jgi:V/A-type H+/Na+-transporting ATPase subunit E
METVRTSEVLESQILEDARARAKRLLQSADKECAAIRAEAERRDGEETRRLDAVRDARMAALRSDQGAALPLDFLRSRLEFLQKAVSGALQEMFDSFSADELHRVIGRQVARGAFAFNNQHLVVRCAGISEADARGIVAANVTGATVNAVTALPSDQAAEAGKGLIVETADGSRRFRATLRELSELLLEEHREELVTALLGKDVLK